MKKLLQKLSHFAPSIVRVGMSLVFLWFGVNQLMHPEFFVVYLPPEISLIPLSPETFVLLNGGFEIAFGILLILGIFTRFAALLLGLHLAGITLTIGLTEIGVRDLGLTLATISIFLAKPDKLTLDGWLFKKTTIKQSGNPPI